MNTPTKIPSPKIAAPLKPGALDLLSIARIDIGDVRDTLPPESPIWRTVDAAHHLLGRALALAAEGRQ